MFGVLCFANRKKGKKIAKRSNNISVRYKRRAVPRERLGKEEDLPTGINREAKKGR